jgi:hypothetical protein
MFCLGLEFCLFSGEEHRLRAFRDRVLRKILESERDKVTGQWRKVHNVELQDRYTAPNVIRLRSMVQYVACLEEKRSAFTVFVGKCKGRRPLGRPWYRWEDDMNMDLKEMEDEVVDWINFVNFIDGNEPLYSIECREFLV